MYGAFPNVSSALGQAYDMFRQRIDQNPALRDWWAKQNERRSPQDLTLEEMIAHVRSLGGNLGEEIAVAVTGSRAGPSGVIVLADVTNAAGTLSELKTMASASGETLPVLTDPAQLAGFTGSEKGPVAFVGSSILVLASSPKALDDVIASPQGGGFASQPFFASIQQAYAQGAATLFAADLATLFSGHGDEGRFTGLSGTDRFVLEQKQIGGKTVTQAQLSFNGERQGAAAWLAPAAPMGALEFVSPQAYGIASAVTKDAAVILDEILKFGQESLHRPGAFDAIEQETGIDIRHDLAEPLGGEFLVALDGPFLPAPSWKLVAEVYDSARLQNTIERLVSRLNNELTAAGGPAIAITSEAAGGQIYYSLRPPAGLGPELHYTYAMGYIVAAPSRALVTQALQYQQSRSSIANSGKFRSMMPADGADYCSAILYQNLVEATSSIAGYIPSAVGGINSQQLQMLKQTVELTPPTLVCANGEPNRIVMGYQGDLAFNVLMLGGLKSMMQTVAGPGN
jgi:hypothetical protein